MWTFIVMWTFLCIYILHYYYLWNDVKISLWTYYYILFVISLVLFGKYRNRTEFTDTEFSRYQVFIGTDRYQFLRNRICNGTEEPNWSVRYLPNAQADQLGWAPPTREPSQGPYLVVGLSRWRSTLTFCPFVQFKILCCRFPWIHFSFSFFMPCTLYFSYPFPATPLNWRNGIYLHFHVRCRHIGERTRNQTVCKAKKK